jgi:hypothetical protein
MSIGGAKEEWLRSSITSGIDGTALAERWLAGRSQAHLRCRVDTTRQACGGRGVVSEGPAAFAWKRAPQRSLVAFGFARGESVLGGPAIEPFFRGEVAWPAGGFFPPVAK